MPKTFLFEKLGRYRKSTIHNNDNNKDLAVFFFFFSFVEIGMGFASCRADGPSERSKSETRGVGRPPSRYGFFSPTGTLVCFGFRSNAQIGLGARQEKRLALRPAPPLPTQTRTPASVPNIIDTGVDYVVALFRSRSRSPRSFDLARKEAIESPVN